MIRDALRGTGPARRTRGTVKAANHGYLRRRLSNREKGFAGN